MKNRCRFWVLILMTWIIPFLTLVGMACAATYYVDLDGNNVIPYDSLANASTTIKTVVDYIQANYAASNTIVISNGTYNTASDYFLFDDANHANTFVIGESTEGVIINPGTGNHTLIITSSDADNITIQNITLIASGSKAAVYKIDNVDNLTLNDCIFKTALGHTNQYLVQSMGDRTDIKYCKFYYGWSSVYHYPLNFQGDSYGTIQYCLFTAAEYAKTNGSIRFAGSGVSYFYNNIILDSYSFGVQIDAGIVTLANNIIQGGLINTLGYCIIRIGGTVTANNNYLISNILTADHWISGTVTENGNIKTNADPRFTTHARKGYIIPRIDDTNNWTYMKNVAIVLKNKEVKGTCFLNKDTWSIYGNVNDLRQMIQNGYMEVACHSWSHSNLTYTHALHITYTGGGNNPICSFVDGNIILTTDNDIDRIRIDTISANKDTSGEIIGNYGTGNVWTISESTTGGQSADNLGSSIKATSYAIMTATDVPCDIDFNRTGYTAGYFKDEIADPKTWLTNLVNSSRNITDGQTGLTYVCNSYAWPFNTYDSDSHNAVIDANYIAGGTNRLNGYSAMTGVTDLELMTVYSIGSDIIKGADEATTRKNARAFGFGIAHAGLVVSILSHNTSTFTVDEWGYAIEEWKKIGSDKLEITSLQLVANEIRNSGNWTNDGDGSWSRTYTTESNYYLDVNSPCIDAGNNTVDSGSTDFAGHHIPRGGGVDIGAYEYSPIKLFLSK